MQGGQGEERIYCGFSDPGRRFLAGEPIEVSVYPYPDENWVLSVYRIEGGPKRELCRRQNVRHPLIRIELEQPGDYRLVIHPGPASPDGGGQPLKNSRLLEFSVLPDHETARAAIRQDRIAEHKIAVAFNESTAMVRTLHDPWVLPPHCMERSAGKWFLLPVFEGLASVYNETEGYYADPSAYFLGCMDRLRRRGFRFVTWHQLLDDQIPDRSRAIILQFDLDAGVKSMVRLARDLLAAGVTANLMIHRRARHWYVYDLEDLDLDSLQGLEQAGWCLGYHHNALTNLTGFAHGGVPASDTISRAQELMREDVETLRRRFDIRTLTHHGGNVINWRVPVPDDLDVVCVDRQFSPDLWQGIDRKFSDGGFLSRPGPLATFVEGLGDGLHFLRCHPIKYGNYTGEPDAGAFTAKKADIPDPATVLRKVARGAGDLAEIEKQVLWVEQRAEQRQGTPLSTGSIYKPLSAAFAETPEIEARIEAFRARRRPSFLKQYPWAGGDPRVFWWRLITAFCAPGEVLNVGALPADQKDETIAFLPDGARLLELDIDPERQPDLIGDFCDAGIGLDRAFDTVLLFGLPYFSDPGQAVRNAFSVLRPAGRFLLGGAASTHPVRGGLWRPHDRPIWRPDARGEPGEAMTLRGRLWSFDRASVDALFAAWSGEVQVEYFFHYWFVVATKAA